MPTTTKPTERSSSTDEWVQPAKPRRFEIEKYGTLLFFLAFYVVISVWQGSHFLSWGNLSLAAANNANLALLAAAVTLTLIAGQFDLSVGYLAGMTAVLMAYFTSKHGTPVLLALLIVVVCGILAGVINGLLVTRAKVNAFIATLGTGGVFGGVSLWVSGGQTIFGGIPASLTAAGTHKAAGIPLPLIFAAIVLVVMWALTKRTIAGRFWYASGANSASAELAGVPVSKVTIMAFVGTGLLAALAGVLEVARFGSADPGTGPDLLLPAFASAFLGSSILSDGRFTIVGAIVASFLITIAENGLNVAGVNFAVQPIFNGLVLVAAVALTEFLRRRRKAARSHGSGA